jgi:hypothetical protein
MFKPGDSTSDEWFGRFCGPKRLSAVPIETKAPARPAVLVKPVKLGKPVAVPPPVLKSEETNSYSCVRGIYRCKLCDIFRTGSFASLQAHLDAIHGYRDGKPPVGRDLDTKPAVNPVPAVVKQEVKLGQDEGEGEVVAATSRQGMSAKALEREAAIQKAGPTVVTTVRPEPVVVPEPEPPAEPSEPESKPEGKLRRGSAFTCPYSGCGKNFKSQRGLATHIDRMHK